MLICGICGVPCRKNFVKRGRKTLTFAVSAHKMCKRFFNNGFTMLSLKEKLKKFMQPVDMRVGKEWKVLILFSLPIIFSYLLQQVYIISDAAICGQTLSSDEVAGVNDVSSLIFIFLQFAFGCTAGFGVITSNRFGEGDESGVRRSFAAQIVLSAVITVILTVVSVLSLKHMFAWINVTPENPEVFKAAYSYCLVIFAGIFAQMFYNFVCTVLRSVGDSVTPLVFLFASTLLNIGLDLLFIKVFKLGVIGAAAATVVAQGLSTLACFVYTFAKYKNLRLKKEDFRFGFDELKRHLVQGVPLGLQFSVLAVGIIVMQGELIKFDLSPEGIMAAGNPAQNGYGAACKLGNLLMSPMNAFGAGVLSFTAQNFGAREYGRIRRGTAQATLIVIVMYVLLSGCGLLLTIGGTYQRIFLSADKITPESIWFGNTYLYIALSFYFMLGLLFVWRSGAQGVGKPSFAFFAGTAELVARILFCLLLPQAVNGGAVNSEASAAAFVALCIADPVAWLSAIIILAYPFVRYNLLQKYKENKN